MINFIIYYGCILIDILHRLAYNRDFSWIHLKVDRFALEEKKNYSLIWYEHNIEIFRYISNSYVANSIFTPKDIWTDRWAMDLMHHQYRIFIKDNYRFNYRLNFFKTGFYSLFTTLNPKEHSNNSLKFFFAGYRYFLKFFSKWFLPLLLVYTFVFYSMVMQSLPFVRVIFVWISVFSVVYLLTSGFVFFFKKYQYGKFTSVTQRFWKRSLIIFWLIEGFLLLVFFYLTINSTWYLYNMSDQSQLFRTFLFSWRLFLIKLIPLTLLLLLTFIFLINNKWQTFTKNSLLLIVITSLLLFITWIEFYQFYHVINYHHGKTWGYGKDEFDWVVEQDLRKTLGTKSYVNIMLILKFWHVLFVTGMWLFFVLRSNESDRIRYPLIAGNFLNFVMLYLLSWVYMYPWFRLILRQYFSYTYRWFYLNNRGMGLRLFFNDLQLLLSSFSDLEFLYYHYFNLSSFKYENFFFFKSSNQANGFVDFNKRFSSNQILGDLLHQKQSFTKNKSIFETIYQNNSDIFLTLLLNVNKVIIFLSSRDSSSFFYSKSPDRFFKNFNKDKVRLGLKRKITHPHSLGDCFFDNYNRRLLELLITPFFLLNKSPVGPEVIIIFN